MADAVVSALVQTILGNLSSFSMQQIGLVRGLKDELDRLESTLSTIEAVLADAEMKQRKSKAISNWLRKLEDAVYDAENILDEVATEGLVQDVDSKRGNIQKLNAFFSKRNPLIFKLRMGDKVKKIRERLDAIAEERVKFHLERMVSDNQTGSRQTSSLMNESEIFGRQEERDMIVEKLVYGTHQHDFPIYVIYGMGGIGKTTLAQLVYNHERVKGQFDLRIWVCVSDDFSIPRLIKAILESMGEVKCKDVFELDPLQLLLREKLGQQRYLLVLDDVWNENDSIWDSLKEMLRGPKGSVVMVTTRSEKVAIMMATIGMHHIQYLSEEDSWSLFKRRAFVNGQGENQKLEKIGKEIVRKCGGLALAVKTLGSLMRYQSSESEWSAIQASEIWRLSDGENGIAPVLRLSYDNLKPQLRQCFAYCCIFPKGYEMPVDMLVQLWMANGFVSSDGQTDLPSNGRLIFNQLVWRSFIQDVKKNSQGKLVCKMHDLMHDLAKSVMNETCILDNTKVVKDPKIIRHLSFTRMPEEQDKLELPADATLRSLIFHDHGYHSCSPSFLTSVQKQQYLRVLQMNTVNDIDFRRLKLHNVIFKMMHLRYLSMSCSGLKRIPESLTRLQNLQTLKLVRSTGLVELPKGLKYLKDLCFLEIEDWYSLVCTPPALGELTCLQELSIFIVGRDTAHKLEQLKDLNLGGDLSIKGLDFVRNFREAKSASLATKVNLKSLSLSWIKESAQGSVQHCEEVLEGLQPNEDLEKLCIEWYQGSTPPKWLSTLCLKKLNQITLSFCLKWERLPQFGQLPSLTDLKLNCMDSVKHLDAEWLGDGEVSFPELTYLRIAGMDNLEEWTIPNSVKSFPCLTNLVIDYCLKLIGLPSLPALKSLYIRRCPNLVGFPSLSTLESLRIEECRSLIELPSLPTLKTLRIRKCPELVEFPSLPTLESLEIIKCPKLNGLPSFPALKSIDVSVGENMRLLRSIMRTVTSVKTVAVSETNIYGKDMIFIESYKDTLSTLESFKISVSFNYLETIISIIADSVESLKIWWCNSITSIPATTLEGTALGCLEIHSCRKLKDLFDGPFQSASALQSLSIRGLPELESLPECMEQLSALTTWHIAHCEKLRSLPDWLGSLQSLHELQIDSCYKIKSLPDCLKSLKALQKLNIYQCPSLETRCAKPNGEDWPKISHIPNILIDYVYIQSSFSSS